MKKVLTTTILSIVSVAIIFLASTFDAKAETRYPTSCTLSKKNATDVLIKFNNANHANPGSDYGLASHKRITGSWYDYLWQWASIPKGNYKVVLQSADGYVGRSSSTGQTNERFSVELYDQNNSLIQKTGASGDIPDGVENGFWSGAVGNVSLNRNVTNIVLRHVVPYENSNPNSHVPVCMLLEDLNPPTPPVNGQCNSSYNGQYLNSKPTSSLCTKGSASSVGGNGSTSSPWSWTCSGSDGGSAASCKAYQKKTPVDGECNSQYNGQTLTEIPPTGGLCTVGTESAISGNGSTSNPWTWTCDGIDGGNSKTCSTTKKTQQLIPSIQIIKDDNDNNDDTQTVEQNGTATFSIKVTNNGDVDLINVAVTDTLSPNCEKTIGSLSAGFMHTYTCTDDNVQNSYTNVAVVNGEDNDGTSVTDNDNSDVVVNGNPNSPSIQIIKDDNDNKDDTQTIDQGGTATFSIVVTNTGNVDLTNVAVTDTLSPNCDKNIGDLQAGFTHTYTCTIENVTDSFTNVAVVDGEDGDGTDVTDNDDSDVVVGTTPPNNASINIDKNDNGNHDDIQVVSVGGTATFLITVTNDGDVRLNNIIISDELAPDCSKITAETVELIEVKYGAGHIYLDPNESFSYTCTDSNIQDDYTNIAVVDGEDEDGNDVTDEDDSDVIAENNPCTPEIRITKDDNDNNDDTQTIEEGGTAEFTILVENRGNVQLTDIIVTDSLAPSCAKDASEVVSLIETKYGAGRDYLEPWESFEYTCTDTGVQDSYTNTAITEGTYYAGTVTDEDDSDVVVETTPVLTPAINIVKEALDGTDIQTINEGETVEFRIIVTNTGSVDLTNVAVTDTLSPNCDKNIGDLQAGFTHTYTCTIDNVTESFTNVAVVDGEDGDGTDVTDEDDSDVVVEEDTKNPSISIIKDDNDNKDDTQTVVEGKTATFSITVTNDGDVDLTNVVVTDILAPNCNKTIGNLAIGEEHTYTCTIDNVDSSFTNTAVVTADDVTDEDQSDVVVTPAPNPEIVIIKDDDDVNNHDDTQTVNNGGTATFNIYVKNTGNVRLTDVSVTDNTVADCSVTTSEATDLINQKYGHNYLEPGESFHYSCTDSDVTQGYTNTATTEGTGEGQTVNDTDTSDVIVDCNCTTTDVNIVKEAANGGDTQTINEGDDAYFKITVENTGTARLNEVSVSDAKVSDCNISISEAADLINQKYGHTYLDSSESFSYECTDENVEESYTNVAIVTVKSDDSTDQDSDSTDINIDEDDVCNGSIGDFVWNDRDKDGVQDSNEEGISGVRLKLYNGNDVEKDNTNGQGFYEFDNLCEGGYDVVVAIETLPEGCYQTYDYDGSLDHSTTVDISSGEDFERADFGYYCPTNTSVVTPGTSSPVTGAGAVAGGAATLFASGAAWLAQRRTALKAGETLIKFVK